MRLKEPAPLLPQKHGDRMMLAFRSEQKRGQLRFVAQFGKKDG